jgi:NADH-quinone oxidoreductase subunit L
MLKYALIPLLPFAGFLIAGLFGKFLKERAAYFAIAGVVGAFLLSVSAFFDVLGGTIVNENLYSWISIGTLSVNVGLQIDQLTTVMLLVVTTLSSLIHIYSVGYMHGDKGFARFFSYLALFTFFMLVLVMANSFLLMFVGWEGVGLCSYLLIGFWYEKKSASDAGIKAFVVNRVGDFGFLLGMLLIFVTFGTLDVAGSSRLLPIQPPISTMCSLAQRSASLP